MAGTAVNDEVIVLGAMSSRMAAAAGRRAAAQEEAAVRYVDAVIEWPSSSDEATGRTTASRIGLSIREARGQDVLRIVDGPEGEELFRLDSDFVGVIDSLGLDRFYATTGDHRWPSCHIARTDLMDFIRECRPNLMPTAGATFRP